VAEQLMRRLRPGADSRNLGRAERVRIEPGETTTARPQPGREVKS
jgi:hypothetical protein